MTTAAAGRESRCGEDVARLMVEVSGLKLPARRAVVCGATG